MSKIYKIIIIAFLVLCSCKLQSPSNPAFKLMPAQKIIYFKGNVDCNMAEAWIRDTFRIFSGKYGEDPVWGYADVLRFASGANADTVIEDGQKSPFIL